MPTSLNRARLNKPTPIELSQDGQLPEEILVLPVGKFNTYIGEIEIDDAMLSQMTANHLAGIPNGVPINLDHNKKEAAGWITGLIHRTGEGLYAAVEWTSLGKEKVTDKIYRFVSAEFSTDYIDSTFGKSHGNVLSGLALTNYPMLQNIPALLSQESGTITDNNQSITILFSQEGESMNLEEIRAKAPADLSEDEKTFLQDNADQRSADERTNFGFEEAPVQPEVPVVPAEPAAPAAPAAELSQGNGQTIQLSQEAFSALQTAANAGARAMTELNQARAHKEAETYTFSQSNQDGVFLPKSTDKLGKFIYTLSQEQKKEFNTLMAELPKGLYQLTQETGHGANLDVSDDNKLHQLAQAKVEAATKVGQTLEYSQAIDQVISEHSELVDAAYGGNR